MNQMKSALIFMCLVQAFQIIYGYRRPFEITNLPPVISVVCGQWVNLTTGNSQWVTSPDYPTKYPPNTDCVWTVNAPFGTRIWLTFEHFVMQPGHFYRCFADYFSIEDSGKRSRYCGFLPRGKVITTLASRVDLRFVSDNNWENVGFRIRLEAIINKCSATIENTEKGTISSPNYPLAYPANTVCTWKIEVPLDKRIVLDCQEPFHIQSLPERCMNDFLTVSTTGDESFEKARRFCWTKEPQTLISLQNVMTILFKSNSWYQTSGFRCEFYYATVKRSYNFSASPLPECKCGSANLGENVADPLFTHSRIVGGEDTQPNRYPWMVAIIVPPGMLGCGGSLINDRYVLTASHCFIRTQQARLLKVALATHDLRNLTSDVDVQLIGVERIILHANFDQETSLHDIALLRLSKSVVFNEKIHPICLPRGFMELENKTVTVIGWGKTSNDGAHSDKLKEVTLRVQNNTSCQTNYINTITSEMICAGDGNKDACQGDSGGPLMLEVGEMYIQVGIVSFGLDCGIYGVPGVYTRVDQYLDFISQHSIRADRCVPLKGYSKIERDEILQNQTKISHVSYL